MCLRVCACLRVVCFCKIVCDSIYVDFLVCQCLSVDVFVLGLCVSGLCIWCFFVCVCVCFFEFACL